MATSIIAAKTASENSTTFHVRDDDPVTVFAAGTLVAEEITLQISSDGGTTWFNTGQVLTVSEPCLVCYGQGTYRAAKPTTANSVGVSISSKVYGL